MITASQDFITAVTGNGRHFNAKLYSGGTEVTCDIISITSKKGAQDGSAFSLGSVFSSSVEITCSGLSRALENEDIELRIGILTNRAQSTYSYITYGKYTVIKAQGTMHQTVLTCVGFISSKFNVMLPDVGTAPTPAQIAAAIQTATGVTVSFASSVTTNIALKGPLADMSCRAALSVIAFAVGGFATESNTGGVVVRPFTVPQSTHSLSAEDCLTPPVVSEETFEMTGIKVIQNPEAYILTTDTSVDENKSYYTRTGSGTASDPYVYTEVEEPEGDPSAQGWYELGAIEYHTSTAVRQTYENEYISQAAFNYLASVVVGIEFVPSEIDMSLGDPRLEPWDCLTVTDVDGETTHTVPCHLIESTFDGGFSSKIYSIGESLSDMEVTGSLTEQVKQVVSDLSVTKTAADQAKASAASAKASADEANRQALIATGYANEAKTQAQTATTYANEAKTSAQEAKSEAQNATKYANDSLSQLGIVEYVVGTLNWITTHATYKATNDTAVRAGKWYFTKSGNTYNVVTNPTGNPKTKGYYEIDTIDEAVSNYVASHLALTDAGLWITKDGNGYKILLANDGMKVYDNTGHIVSTFGESITFDSGRPQRIGDSNAYIQFDGNGHISIGGTGVSIAAGVAIGALSDYSTTDQMNNAIGSAVDGIEIGGRNLLLDSDDLLSPLGNVNKIRAYSGATLSRQGDITIDDWRATNATRFYGSGNNNVTVAIGYGDVTNVAISPITQVIGEEYTFSIYIKNNHSSNEIRIRPNGSSDTGSTALKTVAAGEMEKLSWTWKAKTASNVQFNIGTAVAGDAFDFTLWHPMWAVGNKVVDWTPAPEDAISAINAVSSASISETVSVYYRSTTHSAPSISSSTSIGTATNTDNAWEYIMPVPKRDRYFYTCEKYIHGDGSISFSTVRELSSETYASKWVHASDSTYIDGGMLYANSVTADQINANDINANKFISSDTQTKIKNGDSAYNRATAYRGIGSRTDGMVTVACSGFTLATGATISVYFGSSCAYTEKLTLNVNSTGAKDVYVGDLVTSDTNRLMWHWGSTITFTYDGTNWRVSDAPASYYGTTCASAASTAPKSTRIPSGVLFKGCTIEVPMTYANTASTPYLSIGNTAGSASNLTGDILYGTGLTVPTEANGYSWLADMSVIFKYDGKYWRTGNQTIIDGGHILTGTINADRIGANSITANKIAIGDFNNYITATETDETTLDTGNNPVISNGWLYKSNATASNIWLSPKLPNWVKNGDKYRITGKVKAPAAGCAVVAIYGRDASDSIIVSNSMTTVISSADTETEINGIITISGSASWQTAIKTQVVIVFCTTSTWTSNYQTGYCKQMKCERMSGGELIVDGAITTDKLDAGAVTIGKINSSDADTKSALLNSAIDVGGENLLRNSKLRKTDSSNGIYFEPSTAGEEYIRIHGTSTATVDQYIADLMYLTGYTNMTVTISANAVFTTATGVYFYVSTTKDGAWYKDYKQITYYSATERRLTINLENGETLRYLRIYVPSGKTVNGSYRFKIEVGNKQTFWSPSREDVDADISDAAKTATSYITKIDDGGIDVHNSESGYYTHIDGNSISLNDADGNSGFAVASSGNTDSRTINRNFILTSKLTSTTFSAPITDSTITFKATPSGGATTTTTKTNSQIAVGSSFTLGNITFKRVSANKFTATLSGTTRTQIAISYTNANDYAKINFTGENNILWSGAVFMVDSQTITLNESVSEQLNGIILCWGAYVDGTAQDYDWNYTFIPKDHVVKGTGGGISTGIMGKAFVAGSTGGFLGMKYVYVEDTQIRGHSGNNQDGTFNGLTITNRHWVLRYVVGV